jgi:DNA mismatch endonuclease, patch repair protein
MVDRLTREQRSFNMSRIRGRDTKPELTLRRGLHGLGFRFRLHRRDLPGRPDLVFPGRHAAIFVHGCFWHGHHCPMCQLPATRTAFWQTKMESNCDRDRRAVAALAAAGWRVLVVWECALRGPVRLPEGKVAARCASFLLSERPADRDIEGDWPEVRHAG